MEVWKEVMPQSRFPPVFCCLNIDKHFSTFGSEVWKISHNKVDRIFGCICCQNISKRLFCWKHLLFFSISIPLLTDAFSTQKYLYFSNKYQKYRQVLFNNTKHFTKHWLCRYNNIRKPLLMFGEGNKTFDISQKFRVFMCMEEVKRQFGH